jgi:hypothetical protein
MHALDRNENPRELRKRNSPISVSSISSLDSSDGMLISGKAGKGVLASEIFTAGRF